MEFPTTLVDFMHQFPDDEACRAYLERMRWPKAFICPRCQGTGSSYIASCWLRGFGGRARRLLEEPRADRARPHRGGEYDRADRWPSRILPASVRRRRSRGLGAGHAESP